MHFEHLKFKRHWDLTEDTLFKLGQCKGLITSLKNVPLRPEVFSHLKRVSLVKGAQATTAIEGNTLTEEDIQKIVDGVHLSESKAYQEKEVKNIVEAMNQIQNRLLDGSSPELITPDLLKRYHYMVGKGLEEPFKAIPGELAQSQRVVMRYRCPPPGQGKNQVAGLLEQLCSWLRNEFGFESNNQSFRDGIIQAIVTHVYIEWIHPFDDGNGRTGRLVEFYLLLRSGVPDICAHILSNHYNNTRPEYYANIDKCFQNESLTQFINYSITGFFDGLTDVWEIVSIELIKRAWRGYVYDKFAQLKWNKPVFLRRRRLMLDMPIFKHHDIETIQLVTPKVAQMYAKVGDSTIKRDLRSLVEEGLLHETGDKKTVVANTDILIAQLPDSINPSMLAR